MRRTGRREAIARRIARRGKAAEDARDYTRDSTRAKNLCVEVADCAVNKERNAAGGAHEVEDCLR